VAWVIKSSSWAAAPKSMASKFWGGSDGSSEESTDYSSDDSTSTSTSSSSSSYSSSSDSDHGPSKYLQDDSSDSSEDERRIIRSTKEKQYETLKQCTLGIRRATTARDWPSLLGLLDGFHKQFLKSTQSSTRTGSSLKLFARTLVSLAAELDICSQEPEFKKQMSTSQAKAFNSLNQRVKKHIRAIEPADVAAAELFLKTGEASDSDTTSETIDDTKEKIPLDPAEKSMQDIMNIPKEDVTFEMIDSKLKDIAMSRGKKGVDRTRVVEQLRYISTLSKCPAQEVEVLLHIISAQFDLTGSMSTFMPVPVWRSCLSNVLSILQLLKSNSHISLVDEEEIAIRPSNDEIIAGANVQLRGSLCAFTERLDDEYTKSLQCIDAHTKDYVNRLQDEGMLLILLSQITEFYRNKNTKHVASLSLRLLEKLYCKRCHSHEALRKYTTSKIHCSANNDTVEPSHQNSEVEMFATSFEFPAEGLFTTIEMLATYIYKHGDERAKARALLCQIFSEALRGDFKTAKDLLLMSHLQEVIQYMDISTQILFNRTVAQLGICAFERGNFVEAFTYLSELCASGRAKELLAQGSTQARFERSAEQEKLERRRQIPHHLHINIDLIESIFLTCSMLLEVSDLFCTRKTRPFPRNFMRVIENHRRQLFTGPPDGARDTIMVATQMLLTGNYHVASQLVLNLSVWNSLPESKERIVRLIDEQLKIEAIRLYLHQFAEQYTSASVSILAEMVSMSEEKVRSIVNSMIANEEVPAVFYDVAQSVSLSQVAHSRLQVAANTFSEKVLVLLDASERALDRHIGSKNISYQEEDEPIARSRRQVKNSADADEYQSRRSRSERSRFFHL